MATSPYTSSAASATALSSTASTVAYNSAAGAPGTAVHAHGMLSVTTSPIYVPARGSSSGHGLGSVSSGALSPTAPPPLSSFARPRGTAAESRVSPSLGPAPTSCPTPPALPLPDCPVQSGALTAGQGRARPPAPGPRTNATPPPRRSRAASPTTPSQNSTSTLTTAAPRGVRLPVARPSMLTLPPLQSPVHTAAPPPTATGSAGKRLSTHSPAKERRVESGCADAAADGVFAVAGIKKARARSGGLGLTVPTAGGDEDPLCERAATSLPVSGDDDGGEGGVRAVTEMSFSLRPGSGTERRLSKLQLKMRAFAAPAFDMKKVEEVSEHTFRGGAAPGGGDICNAAECHPISRVNDFIYLGTWRDANNTDTLRAHGITYVLNCAKEVDHSEEMGGNPALLCNVDLSHCDASTLFPGGEEGSAEPTEVLPPCPSGSTGGEGGFFSATIPMVDCHKEPLSEKIDAAFYFISLAHKNHAKVLVHCRRGISRSAAVVVAFLMATEGTSFERTLASVISLRPCVSLNLGFREYLSENFHPDPRWSRVNAALRRLDASARMSDHSPGLRRAAGRSGGPAPGHGSAGVSLACHVAGEGEGTVESAEPLEPFSPLRNSCTLRFHDADAASEPRPQPGGSSDEDTAPVLRSGGSSPATRAVSRVSSRRSSGIGLASSSDGVSFSDARRPCDGGEGEGEGNGGGGTGGFRLVSMTHARGREHGLSSSPAPSLSPTAQLSGGGVGVVHGIITKRIGSFQNSSASSSTTGGCITTATSTSVTSRDAEASAGRRLSPQQEVSGGGTGSSGTCLVGALRSMFSLSALDASTSPAPLSARADGEP